MYYVGIDLGGTNIACGIVDCSGKLLFKKSRKTGAHRPGGEIMDDMARLVADTLSEYGISSDKIGFAGVACPGIADISTGVLGFCCNIPGLDGFPIVEGLKERTDIARVSFENDANCAAKGEAICGASAGSATSVFITLGTGVGGGVISDGKILHGINFSGAELGHVVIEKDGFQCSCGRKGCWEVYSSATALVRMTLNAMHEDKNSVLWEICSGKEELVDGRTLFEGVRRGDAVSKRTFDVFVSYLACGITNMVNIFQPDIICLGGGISAEGEFLLAPVRDIVEAEEYSRKCKKRTVIKKAELGNDAGIIGAALLWK